MDRPYQIKCLKSKMQELQRAAFTLDDRMREIKGSSNLKSLDHIILMAALNITNELLNCKSEQIINQPELSLRLQNVQKKIASTLTANQEEIPVY